MKLWMQFALFAVCALALGGNATANLSFDGTLIEPPPCTINSGSTIVTDFGDMGVRAIDGVSNRKRVNYTITCSAGTWPGEMVLKVTGLATTFDLAAVRSSVPDLGIKLLQGGVPFALNTSVVINPAAPPILEAVPVKRSGASLGPGGFTADATLLAQYQ